LPHVLTVHAWYPGQPGSGTSAEWDARDNFKNFASYDAKQCDWMSSGVGSIKRPTKNQVPTFKCMLRLRTLEDYPTAQNTRKFRVVMHDQEVKCFAKSDHNISGGPQDVDKEIAVNVAAITKEWDNPPPAPPARRQRH